MDKNAITAYELQSLVERCFDEVERAGFIKKVPPGAEFQHMVVVNRQEVINHIANTIIGELYELEMIRRMAPMFREVSRLAHDFELLDEREQKRIDLSGLRIAPEG